MLSILRQKKNPASVNTLDFSLFRPIMEISTDFVRLMEPNGKMHVYVAGLSLTSA
jgi:hypothetical protein